MDLINLNMEHVKDITTVNDDTVRFSFMREEWAMLHRKGSRFVLIVGDTFLEDREATSAEAKTIRRIFNAAKESRPCGRGDNHPRVVGTHKEIIL